MNDDGPRHPLTASGPDAVVFADAGGRLTHRTGFEFLGQFREGGVQVGASRAATHWIALDPDGGPDHGSGAAGTATPGPEVTVVSMTRGAVELRLVHVRDASGTDARLRMGGWPVPAGSTLSSAVRPVSWGQNLDDAGTWHSDTPHPVGEHAAIPWIGTAGAAADGDYAAVVGLGGEGLRTELDAAGFRPDGLFVFADGTSVDPAAVWAQLQP